MKEQIHIYPISKAGQKALEKSDAYGLKKILQEVIDNYTCPECLKKGSKLGFFVWENKSKGIAVCKKCGFKNTFKVKRKERKK